MAQPAIDNYSISGDTATMAICYIVIILLITSYISHTKSFRIFMAIICQLILASSISIGYHHMGATGNPDLYLPAYILRVVYYALVFDVMFLFILYAAVAADLEHKQAQKVAVAASVLYTGIVICDIFKLILGKGYSVVDGKFVLAKSNLYVFAYIAFLLMLVWVLLKARKKLYKRVMYGFYLTVGLAVAIRVCLALTNMPSLTTLTYVLPVFSMLYIMHSNPYNITLGSVDVRAMKDLVRELYSKGEEFFFISLQLPEYDVEGSQIPENMQSTISKLYGGGYFRGSVLIQVTSGHLIMIAPKNKNSNYKSRIERSINDFIKVNEKLKYTYKFVTGESSEVISQKNEYASLIRNIIADMPENSIKAIGKEEIDRFNKNEYIYLQLTDIFSRHDLDDPRVLTYCQPVFNLEAGLFDTAEALMRLQLADMGFVYPDEFIPIAEKEGYIHVLTEIILNKTCREIGRLIGEGYNVSRVSVNVSALELKDDNFCPDIRKIIDSNGIPGDRVAIEITESQSEADFLIIKKKIDELRDIGIRFYLDDFGTGYSNIERIMELPFDIIKFDRSMVIASGMNDRSEKIVENLAHMFNDMEYSVLYEGVEDETDEVRCRDMSAKFLQGYKYSRPVPIEHLREFLPKTV